MKNYCCAETFIDDINENKILLKYKFRTDEHLTSKYAEHKITHTIDAKTGEIKMTKKSLGVAELTFRTTKQLEKSVGTYFILTIREILWEQNY